LPYSINKFIFLISMIYLLGISAAFAQQNQICHPWQVENPTPVNQHIYAAALGNGVVVAAGDHVILASDDGGDTFESIVFPHRFFRALHWTGLRFLAGTDRGEIFSSEDGFEWTLRLSGVTNFKVFTFASNDNLILAAGYGKTASSADGKTWTVNESTAYFAYDLLWNGVFFFYIDAEMFHHWTTNGETWTTQYLGIADNFNRIAYDGNVYIATSQSGLVYRSTSGSGWAAQSIENGSDSEFVAHANGSFFVLGHNHIWRSSNGQDWHIVHDLPAFQSFRGLVWTGTKYLAFGASNMIYQSKDGETWSLQNGVINTFTSDLLWDGEQFLLFSYSDQLWSSTNGSIWTNSLLPSPAEEPGIWREAAHSSQGTMVIGQTTDILFKSPGNSWEVHPTNLAHNPDSINWLVDAWFIADNEGILSRSSDGHTWQSFDFTPDGHVVFLSYDTASNGSTFVVAGYQSNRDGFISTSQNLTDWTYQTMEKIGRILCVTWIGDRFLAGAYDGVLFESFDGYQWESRTVGLTANINTIELNNGKITIMDNSGTVVETTNPDGIWEFVGPPLATNGRLFARNHQTSLIANWAGGIQSQTCEPCFVKFDLLNLFAGWSRDLDLLSIVHAVNSPCP